MTTRHERAGRDQFHGVEPLAFFTNAADRMLKDYTTRWKTAYVPTNGGVALLAVVNTNFVATFNVTNAFGVTGIPVWVSNRFVYTPAVQRVLQLAANIYDASTTNYYPSVFRPLFSHRHQRECVHHRLYARALCRGPHPACAAH